MFLFKRRNRFVSCDFFFFLFSFLIDFRAECRENGTQMTRIQRMNADS